MSEEKPAVPKRIQLNEKPRKSDFRRGDAIVLTKKYRDHGGINPPTGTQATVFCLNPKTPDLMTVRIGNSTSTWAKLFWKKVK